MDPLLATDGINKAINIAAPAEAYGLIDAASSLGSLSGTSSSAVAPATIPAHVANELLVQFLPGTGAEERAQVRGLVGANLAETIHTAAMQRSGSGVLERITIAANGGGLDQVREALTRNPLVAFVDLNYLYKPALVSNDPYYTGGSLWGMYGDDTPSASGLSGTTNSFGSQAEKAWNDGITGSRNVVVGIIDEGLQYTHPDLAPNIWTNPFDPVDGVDNDGNGYIDDIHGWDFVNKDNSVYDAGQDSHGTHVAGTIGGVGGNGAGVAGVNWAVTMISTKFLGPNGGTLADAILAIDYLTDLKVRHGINLVANNNSWGGGGYSQALHDAIIRAAKKEILFVAAAGNSTSNNDTTASYPSNYNTAVGTSTQTAASYDSVIAVASITSTGAISSFSSYGATTVDIGAPGSGVISSVPTDTYASYDGTSMATPHVTGAAALYASMQPTGLTAAAIKAALLNSATPTTSLTGKTATGGRLNVYGALQQSAFLSLDRSVYNLSSQIGISINHAAANTSSTVAESVRVTIRSTTETTPETVVLTETGANTGRFTGSIRAQEGTPVADSQLQVADGNLITAFYEALNQTMTATVDASAPVISALTTTARSTSSDIRWSTNEASSTEVLYGTSATNLSSTVTVAGMVTAHTALLGGLAPSTTYYYKVRSLDGAGNLSTSTVQSFTTTAPAPILFVDDDMGASYERFYTAALQANGYTFDTWNVASSGMPPTATDLARYGLVIWNTGFDFSTNAGLSVTEQEAIQGYLNGGGKIFISGQDVLYVGVSTTFRQSYLKVASFANDVTSAVHTETGVAGHPISNGMSLSQTKPSDFPSIYTDGLTPMAGAEGTLLHGVSGASGGPYSAVNYRGSDFAVVFMTSPFEAISTSAASPNNQASVLKRTIDYLRGYSATAGVTVSTPSNSSITTEAGGSATFTVRLNSQPTADVVINLSSSDTSEGSVGPASLTFTSIDWNTPKTVTVTGVDDGIYDGTVAYSVVIAAASSADPSYDGLNPADLSFSNSDNESAPTTRFFVVDDGSSDRTFEYSSAGAWVEDYVTAGGNTAPRGIATTAVGTTTWVVDISKKVYVYDNSGLSLGSWGLSSLVSNAVLEGIATDGTHIWVVDATSKRVYYYANAASRRSGSQKATSSFLLDGNNISPKDIVFGTGGANGVAGNTRTLWVVDNTTDSVYRYTLGTNNLASSLQNSWRLDSANSSPTGIALEPGNSSQDLWVVDNSTDRVYRYANARTLSAPTLSDSFLLPAGGNTNPQGIADPVASALTPIDSSAGAVGDPIVSPVPTECTTRPGQTRSEDRIITKPLSAAFAFTSGAMPSAATGSNAASRWAWLWREGRGLGRRAHSNRWQRRLARLAWLPFQPGR